MAQREITFEKLPACRGQTCESFQTASHWLILLPQGFICEQICPNRLLFAQTSWGLRASPLTARGTAGGFRLRVPSKTS